MRAPDVVFDAAVDLFEGNKHKAVKEYWSRGKTYMNHWDSEPLLVNWERQDLVYGGAEFQELVQNSLLDTVNNFVNINMGSSTGAGDSEVQSDPDLGSNSLLETSANQALARTACESSGIYGIRVYKEGSIVAPRKLFAFHIRLLYNKHIHLIFTL